MKLTDSEQRALENFRRNGLVIKNLSGKNRSAIRRLRKRCATAILSYYGKNCPSSLKLYLELNRDYDPDQIRGDRCGEDI